MTIPPALLKQTLVLLAGVVIAAADDKPLFIVTPLTEVGSFTSGVEGPACDVNGTIYAVNFATRQTIGRVSPEGKAEVFLTLPSGSVGNGIRFGRGGVMYVADYVGHNILRIDLRTRVVSVHAHAPEMNQPNDLAITPDGTIYASDPNWKNKTGQIWRVSIDGTVTCVATGMGTTNGIETSPDGKTLYVNETVQRKVWAFAIAADGAITDQRLIKQFPDHGLDGMRCDVDGNLYITRHGKGTVVKMSPQGDVLREIAVLGTSPTNICFGGSDSRSAYVTEAEQRRIVQFRVDRPGWEWRHSQNQLSK